MLAPCKVIFGVAQVAALLAVVVIMTRACVHMGPRLDTIRCAHYNISKCAADAPCAGTSATCNCDDYTGTMAAFTALIACTIMSYAALVGAILLHLAAIRG